MTNPIWPDFDTDQGRDRKLRVVIAWLRGRHRPPIEVTVDDPAARVPDYRRAGM
jgi:hypothetical protein